MSFYEQLSSYYDRIFPFNPKKFSFAKKYFGTTSKSVLDIGCGTGSLSLFLSKLGFKVTGIDPSAGLLRIAEEKREESGIDISFINSGMEKISNNLKNKMFDIIFCVGNTLPHLKDKASLSVLFKDLQKILGNGGVIVGHLLNYGKILSEGKNFGVIERPGLKFYRFYKIDLKEEKVQFQMELELPSNEKVLKESIFLTPFTSELIMKAAESAGFKDIKFFGGFNMKPFDEVTSDDLVFILR